jgi:hypothetical protein
LVLGNAWIGDLDLPDLNAVVATSRCAMAPRRQAEPRALSPRCSGACSPDAADPHARDVVIARMRAALRDAMG